MSVAEAYPLAWPEGWARTPAHRRKNSRFYCTFGQARDGILDQLRMMGGRSVVLSTNVPLRRDGLPYAQARKPDDCGVAVYWQTGRGDARCMACDRWRSVPENMRAIEKSLEALRGLDRWGSTEVVDRAFRGFQALPASAEDWRSVLGVGVGERFETVRARYRMLAAKHHPDHGGNPHEMQRVTEAWRRAKEELEQ